MTFTTNALTEASATRAAAAPSTRGHLNRHFLAQQLDARPHDGEDLDVAMREGRNVRLGIRKPRGAPRPRDQLGFHVGGGRDLGERQAAAVAPQRDRRRQQRELAGPRREQLVDRRTQADEIIEERELLRGVLGVRIEEPRGFELGGSRPVDVAHVRIDH